MPIDAYLAKTGNSSKVSVEITRRGVEVSLKEAGFFDSGSADLKPEATETLSAIAEVLDTYANTFRIGLFQALRHYGITDSGHLQSTPLAHCCKWVLPKCTIAVMVT